MQMLIDQNIAQENAIKALSERVEVLEASRRSWWRSANKGSVVQHIEVPSDFASSSAKP